MITSRKDDRGCPWVVLISKEERQVYLYTNSEEEDEELAHVVKISHKETQRISSEDTTKEAELALALKVSCAEVLAKTEMG